jgi:Type I restriction enzyme HindI endonuclease subunit-like, C-terminal
MLLCRFGPRAGLAIPRQTFVRRCHCGRPSAGAPGLRAPALATAQVLEELIQLAKDIRAARSRGEETGLTDEEVAFYDALAENESTLEVMGEPTLCVIASELVASIKRSVSVDWSLGEASASQIRLSARLARCGGTEGLATGRGVIGGLGGVINADEEPSFFRVSGIGHQA